MLSPEKLPKSAHTTHPDAQARMKMLLQLGDRKTVTETPRKSATRSPALLAQRIA